MDEESKNWLKRAAESSFEKIGTSSAFAGILGPKCKEDPLVCMQLGFAILNEKPIYIMCVDNEPIPERLRKICEGVRHIRSTHVQEDLAQAASDISEIAEREDKIRGKPNSTMH